MALLSIQATSPERRFTQKEIIAGEERPKYLLIKQHQDAVSSSSGGGGTNATTLSAGTFMKYISFCIQTCINVISLHISASTSEYEYINIYISFVIQSILQMRTEYNVTITCKWNHFECEVRKKVAFIAHRQIKFNLSITTFYKVTHTQTHKIHEIENAKFWEFSWCKWLATTNKYCINHR